MESIIQFFNSGSWGEWIAAIAVMVTGATAITAMTPSKADNAALDMLLKILNILAGNFAKNKNADDIVEEKEAKKK